MAQRLHRAPRPVRELNPEIPSYLQGILDRCLAVDRNLRYASTEQILADLEAAKVRSSFIFEVRRRKLLRPALIWIFIPLLAVGARWVYQHQRAAPAGGEAAPGVEAVQAVAVVPFENRTGEKSFDWYGEGIARLVADNLAQSRHVRIVSMDRVLSLRKEGGDRTQLGRDAAAAGIGFLLTGEIFPGPTGQTLTARLSKTKNGEEVSAKRVDGLTPATMITASDQIPVASRKGLGVPTTEAVDIYAADFATKNLEAYQSYVPGLRAMSD